MPARPLLCVDDESSNLATLRQLLRDDYPLVFAKSGVKPWMRWPGMRRR